ncbi:MAG TPA: ferritin-like domain-containing protein [Nevskiaceae bacterium]|nr:ferritin-like domain-containing protein [Nevskiaceae bacterium]
MDAPLPGDLYAAAHGCLAAITPADKVARTAATVDLYNRGELTPRADAPGPQPITAPGHPSRPQLVPPRNVPARKLGTAEGRAILVHAVAHIEFNAINLAWDAVYRFRGLPWDYYRDWVGVARDEARHFTLLSTRLAELGHRYGDFAAHNGLWEMAVKTADSCLARMAMVPRVLEARGLDATPGLIKRLRDVGDHATADILETLLREEIPHVAAGTRWFRYCCVQQGCEPEASFRQLRARYLRGRLRGPFNLVARHAAGFTTSELAELTA